MMSTGKLVALLFSLIALTQAKESALIKKHVLQNTKGKTARVIGVEKPVVGENMVEELATVEAGFIATFTSKFFEDYNQFILDVFAEKMQTFVLEDHCNEQAVGNFFTGYLCATNQNLLEFTVD